MRVVAELFWPRGGWRRAAGYVMHRLRRLPDTPHRIALGIAIGVLTSFLPIFGLHLVIAGVLAWAVRGNLLAALLGTFFANPLTLPVIAVASMELGGWVMGGAADAGFSQVMGAIGRASSELWHNFKAPFTGGTVHWGRLQVFWWRVFVPYTLGGTMLGLPCALASYYASLRLVEAYQRRRLERLEARFAAARRRERERKEAEAP